MVMATPFLLSLKKAVTGELWGIGKTSAMHIYHGLELFDRYIPYDRKGFIPFLDAVGIMKGTRFDLGVALPHSFRSALLFYGSYVGERIGYARNRRGFMLTHHVPEATGIEPTVEHYLKIIDLLGGKRTSDAPFLTVTDDEERRFDQAHMDIAGPYVAFIVGAQYGPSKRWPDRHFSELADLIVENLGVRVYLLPGKNEEGLARQIAGGTRHADRVEVKSLDITDLKVCISRASAVISNDTGPRHIAAALSVPTVVLLGPMDETYTRYPSPRTFPVIKDIPCRPCNRKRCDRDHECLKGITPEDVFIKVEAILNERNERRGDCGRTD
jgi:heptosyltransferase II